MISPIHEVIEEIRLGRMVILTDEENRENEGDLVLAAQFVNAEHINFMARHGRGLICLTLTEHQCNRLQLPPMVSSNNSTHGTNFTISIDAASGISTGISAADRARTIQAAIAPQATAHDLVTPGHIFPLRAAEGGVLVRAGHTEAGCDLAKLAHLEPCSVICEILKEDGSMARLPDLIDFAQRHQLKIGTIADLIRYRSQNECLIKRVYEREVATPYGTMRLVSYLDQVSQQIHLALVHGTPDPETPTWVRVHEPVSLFDFIDRNNTCHSWSLLRAMAAITQQPCGVMILLCRPETPQQLIAYIQNAQQTHGNTQDLRDYGIGSQILLDLGVRKMQIMATPRKMPSMAGFGLEVTGYVEPPGQTG